MNKTIEGLRKRLAASNQTIPIQDLDGEIEGYTCTFNPPASGSEIDQLESEIGCTLPVDYREFLETCNGCSLFNHPLFGGENRLHSMQEILHLHNSREENKHLLKIAYIYQDHIVIHLEKASKGDSDYLFVKQFASLHLPGGNLHCNFDTWLYRFISTNGAKYWDWTVG